jgi:hypothetical protein
MLQHKYENSRALVIGINEYESASPLSYAVNDASEMKDVLISELGFEKGNVIYLTDKQATKFNILKSFLRFSNDDISIDDRLFVFFAGHGHTKSGVRGEVGYLVPYDASMDDISTFIRWDELTRNAELIRAKHILFVMDACYGGLAVHRDLKSGSSRFLKDMYQRFSRQVITAGKANQVVADAGGPLPNHSVFTGHFIEGIRGKAANEFGVITASGLMAYVYLKVSNDINSEQTPHYGQLYGDGDFIISAPKMNEGPEGENKDNDVLIAIPYVDEVRASTSTNEKVDYIKELISSDASQIKLHDFAVKEVRRFLSLTSEDSFGVSGNFTTEELLERFDSYERHTKDLSLIIACLSHWATGDQIGTLAKMVSRASDRLTEAQGGLNIWLNLRWYPLILLIYNSGISAIESKNYNSLSEIFYTKLASSDASRKEKYFVQWVANAVVNLRDAFMKIPDYEKKYTPMSEYIYKLLQPDLDDMLFLGKGYESIFDDFEILFSLVASDSNKQEGGFYYGPIGRFGWKNRYDGNSPLQRMRKEAAEQKSNWGPIKAGMFGGDYDRFEAVADEYQKNILDQLGWY